MKYCPTELDILSRAYHGAIEFVSPSGPAAEAVKRALMRGLLQAAELGEWDEDKLRAGALRAMPRYHGRQPGSAPSSSGLVTLSPVNRLPH